MKDGFDFMCGRCRGSRYEKHLMNGVFSSKQPVDQRETNQIALEIETNKDSF